MYLLCIGKSYRAQVESEMVAWDSEQSGSYAIVEGLIHNASGQFKIRFGFDCTQKPRVQKHIMVNGVARRASQLVGLLNAVLFSPEDIDLVFGPPSARRRYIDVLIAQTSQAYVRRLQEYNSVLRQRNALLRGLHGSMPNDQELEVWDDALASSGAEILKARFLAVESLAPRIHQSFERLGDGFPFAISYRSSIDFSGTPCVDEYLSALKKSRDRDLASGITLIGPQRDDVILDFHNRGSHHHASRGQARIIALSMRLAEAQLLKDTNNEDPVLLLDDVFSELDIERREAIGDTVNEFEQVIVSTAETSVLPPKWLTTSHIFRMAQGHPSIVPVQVNSSERWV